MKKYSLLITAIIFFLLVNTRYYWEGKLGLFAFPTAILLILIYLGLVVSLIWQLFLAIKERFSAKWRFITVGFLFFVLITTFFRPNGLIDFDKLEGGNILVAEREGVANCMTTLKLKDNYFFKEQNICFGITEITGKYYMKNDTIYFEYLNSGRYSGEYYSFGVIKPSRYSENEKDLCFVRYTSLTDTLGHELWITKNELNKLKSQATTPLILYSP